MSDNNSKKNRSGMADKIVAAVLVFLIFGAGTYGIAREAGSAASRADTGNSQTEQDNRNDGANSGNGAEAVAVDINGGADSGKEGDGQGKDDKDINSDGGAGQDQGQSQGQDQDKDADAPGGDNDGGQGALDDGTIPKDKRKLSTADVRAAFGTGKSYYIAPIDNTGSGSYDIDCDTPIRRFPTLKAGVVSTIKAPATVYVMGFTDGGGWAQISIGGYVYYIPSWCLKGKSANSVPSTVSFASGDVTDQNRFAAVMFTPEDPDAGQYVTKTQAPLKEDPSNAADDVDQLSSGTPVNVIAVSDNGWAKVVKGGKTYYVNMDYLEPVTPPSQDQGQGSDADNGGDKDQAGQGNNGDGSGNAGDQDKNGNNSSDNSSGSDKSDNKGSGSSDKSGSDKSGSDKKDDSSGKSGTGTSDKSGGSSSDKSGGTSDKTSDKSSDKSGGSSSDKSGGTSDKSSDKSSDKTSDKSSDGKTDKKDTKDNKDSKYPGDLMNAEAKKLLKLINDYRESKGVPKLKWSDGLAKAARTRSKEISVTTDAQNKHHKRPNGKDWYTVNPDLMYGENIAYGQKTAEEVFKAFKNSPAHNQTMLDPEYKIFGASLYKEEGTKYTYYWIQEFGY